MSRRGKGKRGKGNLSRRRFLRGMLGGAAVTVGLPWLELFTKPAWGNCGSFPRRFGLFMWGNGVLPEKWVPQGTGENWELSEQLRPLEAVKDLITVVSGLEVKTPNTIPHHSGAAGILTGHPLVVKSHEDQTFAAPSIDQVIAQEVGSATRFRSIEFGAEAEGGSSHNGPDNVNPPESSPLALYERIFGVGFREPGSDAPPDPSLAFVALCWMG